MYAKYFTLDEFTHSITALKQNISNIPDEKAKENLQVLASHLDKIREIYGRPIKVNSGFRCPKLNKAVGGAVHSNHLTGHAADITGRDLNSLKRIVLEYVGLNSTDLSLGKKPCRKFEVIFYNTFIHFAFR